MHHAGTTCLEAALGWRELQLCEGISDISQRRYACSGMHMTVGIVIQVQGSARLTLMRHHDHGCKDRCDTPSLSGSIRHSIRP